MSQVTLPPYLPIMTYIVKAPFRPVATGGYGGLNPKNQNSPTKNFTDNNVFRSSNQYASTLPVVLRNEALECTQMRGESTDLSKFSGGGFPTPRQGSRLRRATILAPPKSSIAPSKFWTWLRARRRQ